MATSERKWNLVNLLATIFVALVTSVITIYFSSFYKKSKLMVSIIDADFPYYTRDSLHIDIVCINDGNTYGTVTNVAFTFIDTINHQHSHPIDAVNFTPVVMQPGEQQHRGLLLVYPPDKVKQQPPFKLSLPDTVEMKIGLRIDYVDHTGNIVYQILPIGFMTFDSNREMIKYYIKYGSFKLNGTKGAGRASGRRTRRGRA